MYGTPTGVHVRVWAIGNVPVVPAPEQLRCLTWSHAFAVLARLQTQVWRLLRRLLFAGAIWLLLLAECPNAVLPANLSATCVPMFGESWWKLPLGLRFKEACGKGATPHSCLL